MEPQYQTIIASIRADADKGGPQRILSIDGNIGAGKTTLLLRLKTEFVGDDRVAFIDEPIDIWDSTLVDGMSILGHYYQHPDKYAFAFQMFASITRFHAVARSNTRATILVVERTLVADKYVFARMLRDDGLIDNVEQCIYDFYHDHFLTTYPVYRMVYIRASPETCMRRIRTRNRASESSIPDAYVKRCGEYHDAFVEEMRGRMQVAELDGEQ